MVAPLLEPGVYVKPAGRLSTIEVQCRVGARIVDRDRVAVARARRDGPYVGGLRHEERLRSGRREYGDVRTRDAAAGRHSDVPADAGAVVLLGRAVARVCERQVRADRRPYRSIEGLVVVVAAGQRNELFDAPGRHVVRILRAADRGAVQDAVAGIRTAEVAVHRAVQDPRHRRCATVRYCDVSAIGLLSDDVAVDLRDRKAGRADTDDGRDRERIRGRAGAADRRLADRRERRIRADRAARRAAVAGHVGRVQRVGDDEEGAVVARCRARRIHLVRRVAGVTDLRRDVDAEEDVVERPCRRDLREGRLQLDRRGVLHTLAQRGP